MVKIEKYMLNHNLINKILTSCQNNIYVVMEIYYKHGEAEQHVFKSDIEFIDAAIKYLRKFYEDYIDYYLELKEDNKYFHYDQDIDKSIIKYLVKNDIVVTDIPKLVDLCTDVGWIIVGEQLGSGWRAITIIKGTNMTIENY